MKYIINHILSNYKTAGTVIVENQVTKHGNADKLFTKWTVSVFLAAHNIEMATGETKDEAFKNVINKLEKLNLRKEFKMIGIKAKLKALKSKMTDKCESILWRVTGLNLKQYVPQLVRDAVEEIGMLKLVVSALIAMFGAVVFFVMLVLLNIIFGG